jgi:hypothetical protein
MYIYFTKECLKLKLQILKRFLAVLRINCLLNESVFYKVKYCTLCALYKGGGIPHGYEPKLNSVENM